MSTTLETMRDRGAGLNVVVLFGLGAGRFGDALAHFPCHDRHDGLRLA